MEAIASGHGRGQLPARTARQVSAIFGLGPADAFHTLADVAKTYHLDLGQLLDRLQGAIGIDTKPEDKETR